MQALHFMHLSLLIFGYSFFCQSIAPTGQISKQRPHLTHFSLITSNFKSSKHTQDLQVLFFIWSSYSSKKYLMVVNTGLGAVLPSPQRAVSFIVVLICCKKLISSSLPTPYAIFSITSLLALFSFAKVFTFTSMH